MNCFFLFHFFLSSLLPFFPLASLVPYLPSFKVLAEAKAENKIIKMLTSSAPNSSYSSSISSSEPHLPYQHHQPPSTLSFGSQHPRKSPMPTKYPRFYSSPLVESLQTPLQVYGLEQREPSIIERPRLRHQISHALVDIKEDISLQIPRETANRIKRRSTLLLDGNFGTTPRPESASGSPRSRPGSIISQTWSSPPRRLSRRISRRLSIFSSSRKNDPGSNVGSSISSPDLIGSSTQYGGDRNRNYL